MGVADGVILKAIGANLRKARLAAGLTQEGGAELVEIHWKTLGYMEAGKRDFGTKSLAKLILVLKVSPEVIFEGVHFQPAAGDKLVRKATVRKRRASRKAV